jgi:hypothetical protein
MPTVELPTEPLVFSSVVQSGVIALTPTYSAASSPIEVAATLSRFPPEATAVPVSPGRWAAKLPALAGDDGNEEVDSDYQGEPTVAEVVSGMVGSVGPFALGFVFVGLLFGTIILVKTLAGSTKVS